MYMNVLEQEVEALSAEVTRLRLMVHRVTQVMEAPPANRHAHMEPTLTTSHSHHAASNSSDGNLQATVDSYKQLLPLVQLLLAQQDLGHAHTAARASSTDSDSRRREKNLSRRRHHRRRSNRSPASSSGTSTPPSRRRSGAAPSSLPSFGAATAATASSSAPVQPTPTTLQRTQQPAHALALSAAAAGVVEKRLLSPSSKQAAAQATTRNSGSVVDRLRAQRGLTAAADDASSLSTNSSDVMPAFTSQTRSCATSGGTTEQRSHITGGVAPTSGVVKAKHMDAVHGLSSHPRPSQSLMSSKLLNAPIASSSEQGRGSRRPPDSIRSASIAAEDMGYYEFSPVVSVSDIPHEGSEAPLQSQSGAPVASARHGPSTENSVELSEQGRYAYSALGSLANLTAQSPLPEDGCKSARSGTATAASTTFDVLPAERPQPQQQQQHLSHHNGTGGGGGSKALPAHMSVAMRPSGVFSDSSSSSDDDGGAAQTPVVLAASSAARHFGTGVVLGARRPISAHSPGGTGVAAAAAAVPSTMGRATSTKAATSANLLATLRSLHSTDSSSDTTSSSSAAVAAAVLTCSQARQAPKEDRKESSFHSYSEAASSPPGSHLDIISPQHQIRQQRQQPPHDVAASGASQEVTGSTIFSAQRSAKGSPRQREKGRRREMEASGELSHSMSRPQTAHSESRAASSLGRRGSLLSGGYYYGYDFGTGSPSQQSVVSNRAGENGTPISTPGYDY